MGITDKLPLLNSKSTPVKIVGYVVYAFVALIILAALSGPAPTAEVKGDDTAEVKGSDDTPAEEQPAVDEKEEECIDDTTYGVRAGDVLMQTGYFKKADVLVYEGDRIKVIVEPATFGYDNIDAIQPFLFGAISATPECLGVQDVEIVLKTPDYDFSLEYPFAASQDSTEMEGRDWRIEQK